MTAARPRELRAFEVPLSGTVLVEASAGTGKTHTITTLVVRLVLEQGLSVREILVVTFTEAATAELRERVRRRLRAAVDALSGKGTSDGELTAFAGRASRDGRLEEYRRRAMTALRELDLAAISTIHAFCLRILQEHAFESGARFDLTLMTDTTLLVEDVANDYWASRVYALDPSLYALRTRAFELTTARALAAALAKRPHDTQVVPEGEAWEPAALAASVRASFVTARAAWQKDGAAVRELLDTTDALSRQSYSLAIVGRVCDALDAYFAREAPGEIEPSEAFQRLGADALAAGTKKNKAQPSHPFFAELGALGEAVARARAHLAVGLRRGLVDHVRTELPRRKQALRAQGFEDLLFSLDAALRGPRGEQLRLRVAARFRAALIDELQDTDPVQYRIFRRLFHGASALLLVGDPKQSIYAFRGADVFSYVSAVSDAAGAAYTLGENRRSDPQLVRAVNTLFERRPQPFRLAQIGFHPVVAHAKEDRIALPRGASPFEILLLPRDGDKPRTKGWLEDHLPRLVAAEISRFLRSGASIEGRPVRPSDVAVLTRTNAQALATQAELRRLRVPTALQSDESVFASAEAAEVESLLRAVLEPTRSHAVRAALATTVAGLSAGDLAALDADERAWDQWSERFRAWQGHWDEHGFVHAYRRMLRDLEAPKRLLRLVDGERRLTNLLHLGELLHGASARERLGRTALVRWLGLTRAGLTEGEKLASSEASELRLESDAHAVQLLTIHKSKGLEFPVVYCPFLYGCRRPSERDDAIDFHDPDDGHMLKIDVAPTKDSPSLAHKDAEVLAENQRLLYVALTRAKHRCSVVWGAINQAGDSALAYALHGDGAAYAALDDVGLRAELAKLAEASAGTIGVRDLDPALRGEPWSGEGERPREDGAEVALAARAFTRERLDRWFRIGSFTALTRDQAGDGGRVVVDPEALGRDHDEVEERASVSPEGDPAPGEPVILHAFPRGPKAGTTLHAVLEVYDFQSEDDAELRALVAAKLAEAGYADAEWGETLARGVRAMCAAPLDERGLTLRSIPRARRADELEFVLPVAHRGDRGGGGETALGSGELADAFDAHASDAVRSAYGARLRSLRFLPLRGFLRGFIDLVFEHEGRFYVVDYKSNHLGERPEDYRPPRLARAMAHHDYYLQYHLYTVAVHRWLAARVRGYDYDAHFGGVYYLFARGMSPAHRGAGVFADRPSRALVEALSEAIHG